MYLSNYQTNLVIDLHVLSLLFCNFINSTAYHLGKYEPSSPSMYMAILLPSVSVRAQWVYLGTLPAWCSLTHSLFRIIVILFKNGPSPASFSLFTSFQYTFDSKQMFNIIKFSLDSNRGPLVLEATALPTEPQPLTRS